MPVVCIVRISIGCIWLIIFLHDVARSSVIQRSLGPLLVDLMFLRVFHVPEPWPSHCPANSCCLPALPPVILASLPRLNSYSGHQQFIFRTRNSYSGDGRWNMKHSWQRQGATPKWLTTTKRNIKMAGKQGRESRGEQAMESQSTVGVAQQAWAMGPWEEG